MVLNIYVVIILILFCSAAVVDSFKFIPTKSLVQQKTKIHLNAVINNEVLLSTIKTITSIGIVSILLSFSNLSSASAKDLVGFPPTVIPIVSSDKSFLGFIKSLDNHEISKIIFHGINPRDASVLYIDGSSAEITNFPAGKEWEDEKECFV